MKTLITLTAALAITTVAQAQLDISIAVRETGFAGGADNGIGGNGGAGGGIEWINRDGQTLTPNGVWQPFAFTMATDPVLGFAGASADGVLDGLFGTLEHIRIRNSGGYASPIRIYIDDLTNSIVDINGRPQTVNFGDFEAFAAGDEVIFQEPGFSGSTAGNLTGSNSAGVAVGEGVTGNGYQADFQFLDNSPTRWLRLTTFNAANLPNPIVRFDQSSVVSFSMRAVICQEDLGSQGPGTAVAEFCGSGLTAGASSDYTISGAPASSVGAILFSGTGGTDISFLGGNLVSFTNFSFQVPIASDANGDFSVTINGNAAMFDLVMQSAFIDLGAPTGIAFTNAIQARLGQ